MAIPQSGETESRIATSMETRVIKCPVCNRRLINALKSISALSVRTYPPHSYQGAECFLKCHNCKNEIGISIEH